MMEREIIKENLTIIEGILFDITYKYIQMEINNDSNKEQKTKLVKQFVTMAEVQHLTGEMPDIKHPADFFKVPRKAWDDPQKPARITSDAALNYATHIIEILQLKKKGRTGVRT